MGKGVVAVKIAVNRWHGWALLHAGDYFHYFEGHCDSALCGLTPVRKKKLLLPSSKSGWSEADCPDCHRVLKERGMQ